MPFPRLGASHILCWAAGLLATATFLAPPSACGRETPPPRVKIHGAILAHDGTPAAGATVVIQEGYDYRQAAKTRCDADGKFALETPAVGHTTLVAYSEGVREMRRTTLPLDSLRNSSPISITLIPSKFVRCKFVDSEGRPAPGVQVCSYTHRGLPTIVSDASGEASVPLYGEWLQYTKLAGWSPKLGVFVPEADAISRAVQGLQASPILLAQKPSTRPLRVKVLDEQDRPVAGLGIRVTFQMSEGVSSMTSTLDEAMRVSNRNGEAEFDWAPDHLRAFPEIYDPNWKFDGREEPKSEEAPLVLRVVRRVPMAGRVETPPGVDPTGLLVMGMARGGVLEQGLADLFYARCDKEGRFSYRIAGEHSVSAAVMDEELVSDLVNVISPGDAAAPPEMLDLKAMTGVQVRVTVAGYDRSDTAPSVSIGRDGTYRHPITGKRGYFGGSHQKMLSCDAKGVAEFRLPPGPHTLEVSLGEWTHEEDLEIGSEPIELLVNAPALKTRTVHGRIQAEARLLKTLSGKLTVTAVAAVDPLDLNKRHASSPGGSEPVSAPIDAEGHFSLEMAGDWAEIMIASDDGEWRVLKQVQWTSEPVEIPLTAAASYDGRLLDAKNEPLPNRKIELHARVGAPLVAPSATTDAEGRFAFPSLPAEVGFQLRIENANVFLRRSFDPGEVRSNANLVIEGAPIVPPPVVDSAESLANRVALAARDARLGHMRTLVILAGEEPATKKFLEEFVLDYEFNPIVAQFWPLHLKTTLLEHEALRSWIKEQLWDLPSERQISLLILDDEGGLSAQMRFPTDNRPESRAALTRFLQDHAPPKRDAQAELAEALQRAKKEEKCVFLVLSGTRCQPCILLHRWLDDHRALLQRDYLFLSCDPAFDAGGVELNQRLDPANNHGIPCYAILSSQGEILITSEAPIGNIGMPGGLEAKRHFRKMLKSTATRLTDPEIDKLLMTLEDD